MIVIVGAGLSGLTCAKVLHERRQPFMLLEASDGPGGRVRTDVSPSGFRLDRGFQVLFTAYPMARRHLSLGQLKLRTFDPGAMIALDGKLHTLSDPTRDLAALLPSLLSDVVTFDDKRALMPLRREVARTSLADIFSGDDTSTLAYLQERGFSERFVDRFARPFFGGVLLDRSLETSAAMFRFVFKMLSEGETVVPAEGMGAITEQLVRTLPIHDVRYGARVDEILMDSTRVYGVRTVDGIEVEADAVVVAVEPPAAATLIGRAAAPTARSTTTVYFASTRSLYRGKKIVLNAAPDAFVNNIAQMTNVAPSYAPPGQHLISAEILGVPGGTDREIAARALDDIKRMFPRHDLSALTPLVVYRIPFAQFAQPPGFYDTLPPHETAVTGLIQAGEVTLSSSIQGAMLSGQRAAEAALRALNTGSLTPV